MTPRYLTFILASIGWLFSTPASALDLLQCYELALQNDARYQQARAETAAAREVLPQAAAQFWPNLSASLSRNKSATDRETGTSRSSDEYLGGNYGLTLRQPLYRKQISAQYAAAGSQVESAEAKLERSHQELILRLTGTYFDALLAQNQFELATRQKEALAVQLHAAQKSFDLGQGTRTDIDDAKARYDMSVAREFEARQSIRVTRRQLEIIVNRPVEALAFLDAGRLSLDSPMPDNLEKWLANAEEVNPELRSLRADVEVARNEVEKAKAGHMPTVDLVAQRRKSISDSENSINTQYLTSQIGIQVSVPIFAGGYVNAAVRQALSNLDAAEQRYEVRRREVAAEVQKEFQKVEEGILKVRALEQAERSTRLSIHSNQKGFLAGTRTRLDILNAEQQYTNALKELATGRFEYILSRMKLLNLVNGLDEQQVRVVNGWLVR